MIARSRRARAARLSNDSVESSGPRRAWTAAPSPTKPRRAGGRATRVGRRTSVAPGTFLRTYPSPRARALTLEAKLQRDPMRVCRGAANNSIDSLAASAPVSARGRGGAPWDAGPAARALAPAARAGRWRGPAQGCSRVRGALAPRNIQRFSRVLEAAVRVDHHAEPHQATTGRRTSDACRSTTTSVAPGTFLRTYTSPRARALTLEAKLQRDPMRVCRGAANNSIDSLAASAPVSARGRGGAPWDAGPAARAVAPAARAGRWCGRAKG